MGEQAGATVTRPIYADKNTNMLLDLLVEKLGAEPPEPNEDYHVGARYTEIARAHEQWAREIDALRMLCGMRLVDAALP